MNVVIIILFLCLLVEIAFSKRLRNLQQQANLIYKWNRLEYDWPSSSARRAALNDNTFIPENNALSGVKVYKQQIFVTVPRWRLGVPSTLNRVLRKKDQHGNWDGDDGVLLPYPTWDAQQLGNCSALQNVQSMEIDPNTQYMWVIDAGRINLFEDQAQDLCPAKIVVYSLETEKDVFRYEFPNEVVGRKSNFLNDIVLDYVNGEVAYAYMTDTFDRKMVVYDVLRRTSYFYQHSSMNAEDAAIDITINGVSFTTEAAINGIAMSYKFDYVYFTPIAGFNTYRIPTSILRQQNGNFGASVQNIGTRASQTTGLVYSSGNYLYFPSLTSNSVLRWRVGGVSFVNEQIAQDKETMVYIDNFGFDDAKGNLWFTANKFHEYLLGIMDFTGNKGSNFHIWKIDSLGRKERSYLYRAKQRTRKKENSMEQIVRKRFPGYFRTVQEQKEIEEKLRSLDTVVNQIEVSNHQCSVNCNPSQECFTDRAFVVKSYHGCCISNQITRIPNREENIYGVFRTFAQFNEVRQYFVINNCRQAAGCTGGTCLYDHRTLPAVVHKHHVSDPDDIDDLEIDYFSFNSSCKSINN